MMGLLVSFDLSHDWWCARMATRFPKVEIQVTNLVPTGQGSCVKTLCLVGPETQSALKWMLQEGILQRGLILEQSTDHAMVRLQVAGSPLVEAFQATRAMPLFPFSVHGQEVRWLLLENPETTREFLGWLTSSNLPSRILRSGDWQVSYDDLTTRQAQILDMAMDAGYYEYPRRTTLTDLAEHISVSKSTLSEALMVIEQKIMTAHAESGMLPRARPLNRFGRVQGPATG